jgi:hypothetical protein
MSTTKKIERKTKRFFEEGSLLGLDFGDPIINGRRAKASGKLSNIGDIDVIIDFNKKGKVKQSSLSIDYIELDDARQTQTWTYSNYRKFNKATTSSRWESTYSKAMEQIALGTEKGLQRGVDLVETLPGIQDLQIFMMIGNQTMFWT